MPWVIESVWTKEAVKRLLEMWIEGGSASEIACDLNNRFRMDATRSSVLGKIHRMRAAGEPLARRRNDARYFSLRRARAAQEPKAGVHTRMIERTRGARRRARDETEALTAEIRSEIKDGAQASSYLDEFFRRSLIAVREPRRVPIFEVGDGCRWPVGHDEKGRALFCGCERKEGHPSYCERHRALGVDVAATDRSDRKADDRVPA